jgi:hypothetical protein
MTGEFLHKYLAPGWCDLLCLEGPASAIHRQIYTVSKRPRETQHFRHQGPGGERRENDLRLAGARAKLIFVLLPGRGSSSDSVDLMSPKL